MNQKRIEKLTAEILSHGLDGIVLMPGPNMVYLSGMHTHVSERPILLFLPADDDPAVIIPKLESIKARQAGIPEERIFAWTDDEGYLGAFQQVCAHLELSDYLLGVEALHMRVLEYELLKRYAPGLTTAHAEPIMTALRLKKDADELAAMQKATVAAETAIQNLIPRIKIGQTEKEIAAMLSQELTDAGSEANAFPPIVATGPNSASPHAVPTDRPIQEGDLLVIDWGAIVDNYPSDITRTFAVGEVEPEFVRIYDVVREANAAGKAAARPGATGRDIDRAARGVIAAANYGDYFFHRTGHGLGLEVHEPPYIMELNDTPLEPGNVFTVEPGIYLTDRGGVRIEDNVVITEDGQHTLTTFTRELIHVG
ncbi:MAG: Xaa-Pro peptidase family protein [Candidatus Promineifilaceae bacterium]